MAGCSSLVVTWVAHGSDKRHPTFEDIYSMLHSLYEDLPAGAEVTMKFH